ncbi:hypothetical protein P106B_04 [Rhizobium phage vB_RglS_P106B]|uniref:Uncharacterized protein n=1 Tax=Rhizobium phage vB_RglS_P106B TaxID=1458697 RepID=W6EBZ4_9CAUD|nr:hypothetical protein P106B_04 [Rhizobium phage vB_RglS_P106B]AHJ10687.1 hypothetical protein P106B_04 [Rhizobium phage vB_RglS_P106B]
MNSLEKYVWWLKYVKARRLHEYADVHPHKSMRKHYKQHQAKIVVECETKYPDFKELFAREYPGVDIRR